MIKCEVTVCAKINRAAMVKETNDGQRFLSFGVQLPIKGRDGSSLLTNISVTLDGGEDDKQTYTIGQRVRVLGNMTIRKKGDKTFFNLRGDGGVELCKSTEEDSIEGTIDFKGKIGKKGVVNNTDKKGRPFKSFSAFSTDKDGDDTHFTWVRFLHFKQKEDEDFLTANSYIEVSGTLQLGVFHDEISLDCRVDEIKKWELQPKI